MFGKKKKEMNEVDVVEVEDTKPTQQTKKINEDNKKKPTSTNNNNQENNTKEKGKVVKTFNMYKFIVMVVAAAILIAFGIVMFVKPEIAIFALIFLSGCVAAISGLIRIVGSFKKENHPKAKKVLVITCLIHMVIGAYLIIAALNYNNDPETSFAKFNAKYYLLFIAIILYIESVSYFWQAVLYKSETGKIMFWVHIIFMTMAVVLAFLATNNNIEAKHIVYFLAVLAFICALVVGGEAMFGYFKYRSEVNKTKEIKKKDEKNDSIAPGAEDEIDANHTLIIEEPDAHDHDAVS